MYSKSGAFIVMLIVTELAVCTAVPLNDDSLKRFETTSVPDGSVQEVDLLSLPQQFFIVEAFTIEDPLLDDSGSDGGSSVPTEECDPSEFDCDLDSRPENPTTDPDPNDYDSYETGQSDDDEILPDDANDDGYVEYEEEEEEEEEDDYEEGVDDVDDYVLIDGEDLWNPEEEDEWIGDFDYEDNKTQDED